MLNDIAPRATTATMAPNPTPPPLAVTPGNGNGAEVHMAQQSPADGAPKRRTRRQAAPQGAVPAPVPVLPTMPGSNAAQPLSDEELQDLGALQVLAARAGVSIVEYVEDARRLTVSYDRFQAYVAARKAASVG